MMPIIYNTLEKVKKLIVRKEGALMRKLKKYKPTKFKAKTSTYNKELADYAVAFIESLCHTKGTWAGHTVRE